MYITKSDTCTIITATCELTLVSNCVYIIMWYYYITVCAEDKKKEEWGRENLMLRWSGNQTTNMCTCSCQLQTWTNIFFVFFFIFLSIFFFVSYYKADTPPPVVDQRREKEKRESTWRFQNDDHETANSYTFLNKMTE